MSMTTLEEGKDLFSTADIARLTGLSQDYIGDLLQEGIKIRGEKLGRAWIVRRSEVERFLREREREQ